MPVEKIIKSLISKKLPSLNKKGRGILRGSISTRICGTIPEYLTVCHQGLRRKKENSWVIKKKKYFTKLIGIRKE